MSPCSASSCWVVALNHFFSLISLYLPPSAGELIRSSRLLTVSLWFKSWQILFLVSLTVWFVSSSFFVFFFLLFLFYFVLLYCGFFYILLLLHVLLLVLANECFMITVIQIDYMPCNFIRHNLISVSYYRIRLLTVECSQLMKVILAESVRTQEP